MNIIKSPQIPVPKGHYSPIIEHNGTLYISGQLPFKPGTREMPEGITAQTYQVLENIKSLVEAAGSSKEQIIQMRLYIPDVEMWGEVNAVYSDFFCDHRPVRCVVPTRDLHYGALIEIEGIAYVDKHEDS